MNFNDLVRPYLCHHGIKGQKWGIRRYQNPDGTLTEEGKKRYGGEHGTSSNQRRNYADAHATAVSLSDRMKKTFKYSEFSKLQSPEETASKKSGSCHDQVMYELSELKKQGIEAKAEFLIEYDSKTGQGGTTHSFVYYRKNGKTYWLENAWSGHEGVHEYDSLDSIKKDIQRFRSTGDFGDSNKYDSLEFSDFKPSKHKTGESLQELVNICLEED